MKFRLSKKLKVFVDQELPLLLERGCLSDIAEFRNIADFRNSSKALVAQPRRGLPPLIERKNSKNESLGGDLDPGPLPVRGIGGRPTPYQGNARVGEPNSSNGKDKVPKAYL